MRFDLIMKSRTLNTDYSWIYKPTYFDKNMTAACDNLSRIFESTSNKEFIKTQGHLNFYFIPSNLGCVLFRVRESRDFDTFGRPIFSIEGISCEYFNIKSMWPNIPQIITYLIHNDIIYRNECDNNANINNLQQKKVIEIDIQSHNFNYGIMSFSNDGIMSDALKQLEMDIRYADKPFSFVFGTKLKEFYPYNFNKYYINNGTNITKYQIEHFKNDFLDIRPIDINANLREQSCEIYLEFVRKGATFNTVIRAIDNNSIIICECDPIPFENNGINVALIESAVSCLTERLMQKGYFLVDEKKLIFSLNQGWNYYEK